MVPRLLHHFEPQTGWMNDPNGLIFFKGRYHAFFQHNPHAPHWDAMHWGHAVSGDLLHWEELPIVLYPDRAYENDGGCFSGSALEKDGKLYLFYTSVGKELFQTQSLAVSEDGMTFEKYPGNPIIKSFPEEASRDFRDPKVFPFQDEYRMVVGSGKDGVGKVLLYGSKDLYHWEYMGVLLEGAEYGAVIECPDLFPLGDGYVLMFSRMKRETHSVLFLYGDFDGRTFTPRVKSQPEAGPHFYAPQTFLAPDGRRILIAWLYNWGKPLDEGAMMAGALTIPRALSVTKEGRVSTFPVGEAAHLLRETDETLHIEGNTLHIRAENGNSFSFASPEPIGDVRILKDTKTMEVFVNKGRCSASFWFYK